MPALRSARPTLGVLSLSVIAIATTFLSTLALADSDHYDLRGILVAPGPVDVKSARATSVPPGVTKSLAVRLTPTNVTATACSTGCAREAPSASRPLIASLPAGESFEIRILKNASQGFRLRASDGTGPASADERLRIQLSRRYVGIGWHSKF